MAEWLSRRSLKGRGIVESRTTGAREETVIQPEFAKFSRDSDPLAAIGERAERLRTITGAGVREGACRTG
jgi:hypothetical protein